MTRAADDPFVRAEIHDALTACGLDPVTEGAIDGVIAIAGAGTYSYSDAAQVAATAIIRYDPRRHSQEPYVPLAPRDQDRTIAIWEATGRRLAAYGQDAATTLDGATTTGEPNAWPANAGEYAARWNAHDTEWREDHVISQVDTAQRASRCIEHDHEGKIRHLEQGWQDSTNAWHRVHQHPKVAALDDHCMPLADQVLHALSQPHEDTALAEGNASKTRPDLDALMADLRRNLRLYADPAADLIARSLAALAAERARADQAEQHPRDEYHTMEELYEYRMLYNALAFNAWAESGAHPVIKSWRHSDGELCFGGGWFVVTATLPTGLVSNHYRTEHWNLFRIPEATPPEYDGHTPEVAAQRIRGLLSVVPTADREADRG